MVRDKDNLVIFSPVRNSRDGIIGCQILHDSHITFVKTRTLSVSEKVSLCHIQNVNDLNRINKYKKVNKWRKRENDLYVDVSTGTERNF